LAEIHGNTALKDETANDLFNVIRVKLGSFCNFNVSAARPPPARVGRDFQQSPIVDQAQRMNSTALHDLPTRLW
jgi:hypothetical protein